MPPSLECSFSLCLPLGSFYLFLRGLLGGRRKGLPTLTTGFAEDRYYVRYTEKPSSCHGPFGSVHSRIYKLIYGSGGLKPTPVHAPVSVVKGSLRVKAPTS